MSISSLAFKPEIGIARIDRQVYRNRNCDTNLNANTPANQYQRLKRIWNTVGVASSIYTMNLGGLNAYEVPNVDYEVVNVGGTNYEVSPGVPWNQMSDRRRPHIQRVVAGAGTNPGSSSVRRSVTRLRPGALSPGGSGVDIKHNSYDRYLNRKKGRAILRRGLVPQNFGAVVGFNCAFPVYGGKITKTSIVSNCNCPVILDSNAVDASILYNNSFNNNSNNSSNSNNLPVQSANFPSSYTEGDNVNVYKNGNSVVGKIILINYNENIAAIAFDKGDIENISISDIIGFA